MEIKPQGLTQTSDSQLSIEPISIDFEMFRQLAKSELLHSIPKPTPAIQHTLATFRKFHSEWPTTLREDFWSETLAERKRNRKKFDRISVLQTSSTSIKNPTTKEKAQKRLEQIKKERYIAKLLRDGKSIIEIVASEEPNKRIVQRVQNRIADGEDLDRLTPKEIGWKRSVGEISNSDMLKMLKGWEYTFSEVEGDAVVRNGDWDDIEVLYAENYLTPEEYRELLDAARKQKDTGGQ